MVVHADLAAMGSRADVVLGSRSADMVPSVCWGMGLHVDLAAKCVTVWVDRSQSEEFLSHVRQTRSIAAVFAEPFSSRSLQVKSSCARVRDVLPTDAPLLEAHLLNLTRELERVGFSERKTRTMFEKSLESLVAIEFTPDALFEQTPGPLAGQSLWSRP